MINKITVENELPHMGVYQLRELQDIVNQEIGKAYQNKNDNDLIYLQDLDLVIAQRIDDLEFGN